MPIEHSDQPSLVEVFCFIMQPNVILFLLVIGIIALHFEE